MLVKRIAAYAHLIFNRLRAIVRYWSEIATFPYPLHLTPPVGCSHWNSGKKFGPQKTRIVGLPGSEDSLKIGWAVSTQYQRVTDRQTDKRTDVQPIAIITCAVYDWRTLKNYKISLHFFITLCVTYLAQLFILWLQIKTCDNISYTNLQGLDWAQFKSLTKQLENSSASNRKENHRLLIRKIFNDLSK